MSVYQEEREHRKEFFERLAAYYSTPEWRAKAQAVIARDNGKCQARYPTCTKIATQAHHTTYQHVFNEPLFDLAAVCNACHEVLHPHMNRATLPAQPKMSDISIAEATRRLKTKRETLARREELEDGE